jgi:hypothetical protein
MTKCVICSHHPTPRTLLWLDKTRIANIAYATMNALIAGYQAGRLDKAQDFSTEERAFSVEERTPCVSGTSFLALLAPSDEGLEGLVVALTEGLCKDHAAFKESFSAAWCAMKSRIVC